MKSIHMELETDGFEGWFFSSGDSDRCVITLVDSEENNIVNKALARWFGKHGCCSLGLGKWQDHAQRDGLHEWPLEYYGKAIDWLKNQGIEKIGVCCDLSIRHTPAALVDSYIFVPGWPVSARYSAENPSFRH